jgi:hypothetical protein
MHPEFEFQRILFRLRHPWRFRILNLFGLL